MKRPSSFTSRSSSSSSPVCWKGSSSVISARRVVSTVSLTRRENPIIMSIPPLIHVRKFSQFRFNRTRQSEVNQTVSVDTAVSPMAELWISDDEGEEALDSNHDDTHQSMNPNDIRLEIDGESVLLKDSDDHRNHFQKSKQQRTMKKQSKPSWGDKTFSEDNTLYHWRKNRIRMHKQPKKLEDRAPRLASQNVVLSSDMSRSRIHIDSSSKDEMNAEDCSLIPDASALTESRRVMNEMSDYSNLPVFDTEYWNVKMNKCRTPSDGWSLLSSLRQCGRQSPEIYASLMRYCQSYPINRSRIGLEILRFAQKERHVWFDIDVINECLRSLAHQRFPIGELLQVFSELAWCPRRTVFSLPPFQFRDGIMISEVSDNSVFGDPISEIVKNELKESLNVKELIRFRFDGQSFDESSSLLSSDSDSDSHQKKKKNSDSDNDSDGLLLKWTRVDCESEFFDHNNAAFLVAPNTDTYNILIESAANCEAYYYELDDLRADSSSASSSDNIKGRRVDCQEDWMSVLMKDGMQCAKYIYQWMKKDTLIKEGIEINNDTLMALFKVNESSVNRRMEDLQWICDEIDTLSVSSDSSSKKKKKKNARQKQSKKESSSLMSEINHNNNNSDDMIIVDESRKRIIKTDELNVSVQFDNALLCAMMSSLCECLLILYEKESMINNKKSIKNTQTNKKKGKHSRRSSSSEKWLISQIDKFIKKRKLNDLITDDDHSSDDCSDSFYSHLPLDIQCKIVSSLRMIGDYQTAAIMLKSSVPLLNDCLNGITLVRRIQNEEKGEEYSDDYNNKNSSIILSHESWIKNNMDVCVLCIQVLTDLMKMMKEESDNADNQVFLNEISPHLISSDDIYQCICSLNESILKCIDNSNSDINLIINNPSKLADSMVRAEIIHQGWIDGTNNTHDSLFQSSVESVFERKFLVKANITHPNAYASQVSRKRKKRLQSADAMDRWHEHTDPLKRVYIWRHYTDIETMLAQFSSRGETLDDVKQSKQKAMRKCVEMDLRSGLFKQGFGEWMDDDDDNHDQQSEKEKKRMKKMDRMVNKCLNKRVWVMMLSSQMSEEELRFYLRYMFLSDKGRACLVQNHYAFDYRHLIMIGGRNQQTILPTLNIIRDEMSKWSDQGRLLADNLEPCSFAQSAGVPCLYQITDHSLDQFFEYYED